jgi:hypothetical protein
MPYKNPADRKVSERRRRATMKYLNRKQSYDSKRYKKLGMEEWLKRRPDRKDTIKDNKDYTCQVKLARGCIDCGFNTECEALHFDHILSRGKKLFELNHCGSRSRQTIDTEIAKCEVRCVSCHSIRHAKLRKYKDLF